MPGVCVCCVYDDVPGVLTCCCIFASVCGFAESSVVLCGIAVCAVVCFGVCVCVDGHLGVGLLLDSSCSLVCWSCVEMLCLCVWLLLLGLHCVCLYACVPCFVLFCESKRFVCG